MIPHCHHWCLFQRIHGLLCHNYCDICRHFVLVPSVNAKRSENFDMCLTCPPLTSAQLRVFPNSSKPCKSNTVCEVNPRPCLKSHTLTIPNHSITTPRYRRLQFACVMTMWRPASKTTRAKMSSTSFPSCRSYLYSAPDLHERPSNLNRFLLCSAFALFLPCVYWACLCYVFGRCERASSPHTSAVYQSRQAHYVFINPTTPASPFSPPLLSSHLWNFDYGTWKVT